MHRICGRLSKLLLVVLASAGIASCGPGEPVDPDTLPRPDIQASNAFYYYDDLETAWDFYRETLGFETVVDYGFAKILRVAESSYVTLVNAADGMHSSAEPKTVTLTLFTDDLGGWHEYFGASGVVTRVSFDPRRDPRPASFAIEDPEGYLLRFQQPTLGNGGEGGMAVAPGVSPLASHGSLRPEELGIRATMYEVYMEQHAATTQFYTVMFGEEPVFRSDWASVFAMTDSSLLALVNGRDDQLGPTEQNGVTLSFFTSDVDGWFERAASIPGFEFRTEEIFDESGMVRVFVGYDPEGYFLEWDTFGERPDNRVLLRYLSQ